MAFGAGGVFRDKHWGCVSERRLRLASGSKSRSPSGHRRHGRRFDPLEPGTERVVAGGLLALDDPDELLGTLLKVLNPRKHVE